VAIGEAERLTAQVKVDIILGVYSSTRAAPLAGKADKAMRHRRLGRGGIRPHLAPAPRRRRHPGDAGLTRPLSVVAHRYFLGAALISVPEDWGGNANDPDGRAHGRARN
jgi:hypothetical protein